MDAHIREISVVKKGTLVEKKKRSVKNNNNTENNKKKKKCNNNNKKDRYNRASTIDVEEKTNNLLNRRLIT